MRSIKIFLSICLVLGVPFAFADTDPTIWYDNALSFQDYGVGKGIFRTGFFSVDTSTWYVERIEFKYTDSRFPKQVPDGTVLALKTGGSWSEDGRWVAVLQLPAGPYSGRAYLTYCARLAFPPGTGPLDGLNCPAGSRVVVESPLHAWSVDFP